MKNASTLPPLGGVVVWLSGAVQDPTGSEECTLDQGVREFVALVTARVLKQGGTIVHATHPGITPVLLEEARRFHEAGQGRDRVTLVVSRFWRREAEELSRWKTFCRIIETEEGEDESGQPGPDPSLAQLGEWLVKEAHALVAVGGGWWIDEPDRAGLPRDVELARECGLPCFLFDGFRGKSAHSLREAPEVFGTLKNGLSAEENRTLCGNTDLAQAAGQVVAQLGKLFGRPDEIPAASELVPRALLSSLPCPPVPARPELWRDVKRYLRAGTLVPVIGPCVVTFGADDRPFYPWLIQQVATRLDLGIVPETLQELVCTHVSQKGRAQNVCIEISDILKDPEIKPGPLLKRLASISQCGLFLTLGFDPLMEWALNQLRGGGLPVTKAWTFSLDEAPVDLPDPARFQNILGYLFGKVTPTPGFVLWDPDAIEFVRQLEHQLPTPGLEILHRTLTENNLLMIGANSPDWLTRFLIRALRQKKLTEDDEMNLVLADCAPHSESSAVLFYESLGESIRLYRGDPIEFTKEFCEVAFALAPPLVEPTSVPPPPRSEALDPTSIFISYSLKDGPAAFEIARRLRAGGCRIWIDTERLQCGDRWDNQLEWAVRDCGFFVSVISQTTESKSESYFLKERRWAAERAESMAARKRFYFPIIIDDTPWPPRQEPEIFADVGPERAPEGKIDTDLARHLAEVQAELRSAPPK